MTDRSVSLVTAHAVALGLAVPLGAVALGPFAVVWGWGAVVAGATWWGGHAAWALAAVAGGALVHEALHAAAWRLAADLPAGSVRIGMNWRALTPYAHCSAPMPARAYRIGAAVPGVALGLVPAALATASGSGALAVFALLFTVAAAGDALVLLLLRGVPPATPVVDHPERAGCRLLPARTIPDGPPV